MGFNSGFKGLRSLGKFEFSVRSTKHVELSFPVNTAADIRQRQVPFDPSKTP